MKIFINSLTEERNILQIPTSISYVSTSTTANSVGMTGHIQGIACDLDNDRVFISWTNGVSCFKWSDLSLLHYTTASDIDDGTGTVSGTHIGDITYFNGKVYGSNALDFFNGISPNRNMVHEWDANTLNLLRSEESLFSNAIGAMGYDGSNLWAGFGNSTLNDGIIQKVSLTTLEKDGDEVTIPNVSTPTDFGAGIQSLSFFSDNRLLASCDYNKNAFDGTGSNVKFNNMTDLTYDLYRDLQLPYDYGVDIVGNKMYIIQRGGGGISNVTTDILEFDINYD